MSHPIRGTTAAVTIGAPSGSDFTVNDGHVTTRPIDGLLGVGPLLRSNFVLDRKAGQLMVAPRRTTPAAK